METQAGVVKQLWSRNHMQYWANSSPGPITYNVGRWLSIATSVCVQLVRISYCTYILDQWHDRAGAVRYEGPFKHLDD
jgi:hypothetical protein